MTVKDAKKHSYFFVMFRFLRSVCAFVGAITICAFAWSGIYVLYTEEGDFDVEVSYSNGLYIHIKVLEQDERDYESASRARGESYGSPAAFRKKMLER